MFSHLSAALLSALLAIALFGCDSDSSTDTDGPPSAVFVQSNASTNRVLVYTRDADGSFERAGAYETGGAGTDGRIIPALAALAAEAGTAGMPIVDPLFSSDALVLSADRQMLFVANAGSSTVTSFRVGDDLALERVAVVPSGGETPTTLAYRDGLLVVGNANRPMDGTPSALALFRVDGEGALTPAAAPGPLGAPGGLLTHVLFSPDGRFLVAAQLMSDLVTTYPASGNALGAPVASAAAPGVFGLAFLDDATLVSADVGPPMTPDAGTASTYRLGSDGRLSLLGTVPNGQNASCWVAVTPDVRSAYVSNTTSGTISHYRVGTHGRLSLVAGAAAQAAPQGGTDFMGMPSSGPVDLAVSADGRFLYQQWSGRGSVGTYRIADDGALTAVAEFARGDLPTVGAEGMDGF